MQLLYAVDLDVLPADTAMPTAACYEKLQQHLANWLSYGADEPVAVEALDTDGQRNSLVQRPGAAVTRDTHWRLLTADPDRAVRLELRQPLQGLDASFVCRVTICLLDQRVSLRIAMGRDSGAGLVSAIPVDHLRRPAVLGEILKDPALDCRVMGQQVTGRFFDIHSGGITALLDAVAQPRRLPLLLLDASGARRHDEFARGASRELAGLAQVVRLRDEEVLTAVEERFPYAAVPTAGARLMWPAHDVRQPSFARDELARGDRAVSTMTRLIAPFAVAARGRDKGWEEIGRRVRRQEGDQLKAELAAAAAAGDTSQQLALLQSELDRTTRELEEFLKAFGPPDDQEAAEERVAKLEAEAQFWKGEYFKQQGQLAPEIPWTDRLPPLDEGDFTELFRFLQTETDGAIVFTAAAATGWRKSGYPFPTDMATALVLLGQAAEEWRAKEGEIGMVADDWIKLTYGLNSAFTDHGLKKLAKFEYEGETYDRTPHLKLDDNTSPDRVGRVYFAMDKRNWRFIVDHVGLKLYGL